MAGIPDSYRLQANCTMDNDPSLPDNLNTFVSRFEVNNSVTKAGTAYYQPGTAAIHQQR